MALRRYKTAKAVVPKAATGYELNADDALSDDLLDDDGEMSTPEEKGGCLDLAVRGLPPDKSYIKVDRYAIVHVDRRNLEIFFHSTYKRTTKYRPIGFSGHLGGALRQILHHVAVHHVKISHKSDIEQFLVTLDKRLDALMETFKVIDVKNFSKEPRKTPAKGRTA